MSHEEIPISFNTRAAGHAALPGSPASPRVGPRMLSLAAGSDIIAAQGGADPRTQGWAKAEDEQLLDESNVRNLDDDREGEPQAGKREGEPLVEKRKGEPLAAEKDE